MAKNNKNIEDILDAFNGMQRANTPDDFEERLFQRLRFIRKWTRWFRYSAAALIIIGFLNVLTVFLLFQDTAGNEETDFMEMNLLTDTTSPILTISEE